MWPDADEDPFAQRLPAIVAGVLATLMIVVGGLWVSGSGLPSYTPEGVLALAAPPSMTEPYTGPVYAIGDSVLLGAKQCLRHKGYRLDVAENRTVVDGLRGLQAGSADLPDRIVIALGSNGAVSDRRIDRVMRSLGQGRQVYWVTVQLPDLPEYAYETTINDAYNSADEAWPNAHVVDWNALSSANPQWLYSDGTHLTPQGCQGYADMLEKVVRSPLLG